MAIKAKVAIAIDFLSAFLNIPKKQQGKILEFLTKFRSNPTSPGINYEKIVAAKDPNMRSVRIDKAFRGIVLKPEKGNIYVLLWVAHHDRAYKWAENRTVTIHPETGSIQVLNVEDMEHVIKTTVAVDSSNLFAKYKDRHLLRLGVPEIHMELVRGLKNEEDLDKISEKLPQEASEALYYLAAGYTIEETFREMDKSDKPCKKVDENDFESALDNPDSQRRFYIVEDDLKLLEILNAPLEKWRIFLHPSQKKFAKRDWNGPVRILGGAGTGKTVVAMHRAKWLAEHPFSGDNDRILFTTFTKNLAADIRENLSMICDRKSMKRIEVVNLDRWVADFLKKTGYTFQIDYGNRTEELWSQAIDLAPSSLTFKDTFYQEEWKKVIQPQGVCSLKEYFKASRIGRGVKLSRKDRQAVWTVFEEYRTLLNENGLKEVDDAMRDACYIIEKKGNILPYRAIVIDEAQDFGVQAFKLIRRMVPEGKNDIFITGDAHQRIYRHKVVLGKCGINIMGRGRKLRITYRTTDETRKWATGLLEGLKIDDLDGGTDDVKGFKSLLHGIAPVVKNFDSLEDESEFICQFLKTKKHLKSVCLVARTHKLLNQYDAILKEKGIETYNIKRSEPEDRKAPGLRLATMHRVKGLEFDHVIISGVNKGIIPYTGYENESCDITIIEESEVLERALLYVSATRAKKEVVITSFGKKSPFLENIT